MGVPVVTLAGVTISSRLTASMLGVSGLQDWGAADEDDYVHIALEAAADPARLARLRMSLRQTMAASPVGNIPAYVGAVEAAYRTMWQRWCAQG